ncbi:MAG: hypothetical protein Aureis2KO_26260 [Aureisphaera sp.]
MRILLLITLLFILSCQQKEEKEGSQKVTAEKEIVPNSPFLTVLGTIQDAGSPHIACKKECCSELFKNPDPLRQVTSLGLVDPINNTSYLFEATPDISRQLKKLTKIAKSEGEFPEGIFLTHAHIGHYSGLMYLGKEATNANNIPVYAMPRMKAFLETNGPWDQLVHTGNISIEEMAAKKEILLTDQVSVTPFLVPHRDEYSETVGYTIEGPSKKALFIPDIDKWEKWGTSIMEIISEVDYAFVDATFYHGEEINTRDISQIPHPFIIESMALFSSLTLEEKQKIHFIHFNHTNPVLNTESQAYKTVVESGFNVASIDGIFPL